MNQPDADVDSTPANSVSTSPRAWTLLLLNRLHYSTVVLSSYAFGLFLPFLREDLTLTHLQVGLLQGVWWITSAVALVPMSVVLVRLNPNWRVVGALVLITPFVFAQGLAMGFLDAVGGPVPNGADLCGIGASAPAAAEVLGVAG